jgi:hypothetical protein
MCLSMLDQVFGQCKIRPSERQLMSDVFRSNVPQAMGRFQYVVRGAVEPAERPASTGPEGTPVLVSMAPSGPYPVPVHLASAAWLVHQSLEHEVHVVCSIEEVLLDDATRWREVEYARWLPLLACGTHWGERPPTPSQQFLAVLVNQEG